jgi:uncharacterized membrane protein YtjA (UPF0391 family)
MIGASSLLLVHVAMRGLVPARPVLEFLFEKGRRPMLYYAIVFAVLALVAGVLGFVGLGGTFALIAKVLLFVFLAMFVVSVVFGGRRRSAI